MSVFLTLALASLVLAAIGDFSFKQGENKGAPPSAFLLYQSLVYVAVVLAATLWRGELGDAGRGAWLYGGITGVLIYTGLIALLTALETSEATVAAPIFRLNFLLTAVLAIVFLGEGIDRFKVLGLALAAASIAVLIGRAAQADGDDQRTASWARWAWLGLAVVTVGVTGVIIRKGSEAGEGALPLALAQSVVVCGFAAAGAVIKGQLRPDRATRLWGPLAGVFQAAGTILLYLALARGQASVAVPLVQLSFVGTALLAVVFLREAITKGKVAGLVLAVLAVLAFALAQPG